MGVIVVSIILELLVACVMVVGMFLAFIYYASMFFEEKIKSVTKICKYFSFLLLGLDVLLSFSEFSIFVPLSHGIGTIMMISLLFSNYPYVEFLRYDTMTGFLSFCITHILLMKDIYENDEIGPITALSYFLFYTWMLPFIILITLAKLESPEENYGLIRSGLMSFFEKADSAIHITKRKE